MALRRNGVPFDCLPYENLYSFALRITFLSKLPPYPRIQPFDCLPFSIACYMIYNRFSFLSTKINTVNVAFKSTYLMFHDVKTASYPLKALPVLSLTKISS